MSGTDEGKNDERATDPAPSEKAPSEEAIRHRAYEISQGPEAGTPEEDWERARRELTEKA